MQGGWDKPEVVEAQRDCVIGELQDAEHVQPFIAFDWAMRETGIVGGTILDVGCGCGHYGILCERRYPGIVYRGTDASEAMIAQARLLAPLGTFARKDFFENDFGVYDIVLVSQVIEFLPDRWAALEYLLSEARYYVILNRIRLTCDVSHEIDETTYAGHSGKEWLWNEAELITKISQFAEVTRRYGWDNQCCLLVKMK
jgi:SAM-dependent methyltransferase